MSPNQGINARTHERTNASTRQRANAFSHQIVPRQGINAATFQWINAFKHRYISASINPGMKRNSSNIYELRFMIKSRRFWQAYVSSLNCLMMNNGYRCNAWFD
jgi:hypothetical protein